MASDNYNTFNYPYQQSSAQQYSGYQTAPAASNNASQPSQQYQQAPPVATTQAADYMSYPAQSYSGQSNTYSGGHDNSWTAADYGAHRETTSRAAEVLRNMSNNSYTPSTTGSVIQSGLTATNTSAAISARYPMGTAQSQRVQPPHLAHATQNAYGTSQARPRSSMYNQPQRSASPVPPPYAHRTTTPIDSGRSVAVGPANQYHGSSRRHLPTVEAPRNTQTTGMPTSYSYAESQVPTPVVQTTPTISEQYNQNAVTVDPMAVYDPWPQYQRKQEALRAQKAIEDDARAEEERKAEEARLEEERKTEEEERARHPIPVALPPTELKSKEAQPNKKPQKQQSTASDAGSSNSGGTTQESYDDPAAKLEAEIRAMMAKMRELNGKDPALLARIWEEERRSKAPKSPTPQPVQVSVPQTANHRKKAVSKEASDTAAIATKPLPPTSIQPAPSIPKAQATASSARPAGNTIWPPEKKSQLAKAAAVYLKAQNPSKPLDADKILIMLDSNPSYIELCERLETLGLKLDRAAFAKSLLTAVPDVNSASRHSAPRAPPMASNGTVVQRVQAPPALPARNVATPAAPSPQNLSPASSLDRRSLQTFPDKSASASHFPVPVAEMVPIKVGLTRPANKEEAARKRNFNDLIDLTFLSEEEDGEPPLKKQNVNSMYSYGSPGPMHNIIDVDERKPLSNNFPVPASSAQAALVGAHPPQYAPRTLRYPNLVQPLDRKKALRRNTYNIKTIARDVLLACGRHPDERQLNAHLDILRTNLPQITSDADLSTIRWDLIDPGEPPRGYFQYGVQGADVDDADDESTDNEDGGARARAQAIGSEGAIDTRVQALPEATNPFKVKRRGRPPRHSAFRAATQYGPDGNPLPKKKGRPVGWRKSVHGSPMAQSRPGVNGHSGPIANRFVPSHPSTLRTVRTGDGEPILLSSRSPSIANNVLRYEAFKCRWGNCKAELHNMETLKKHVLKIHRKETPRGTLECLWGDCGKEVTSVDQVTNLRMERHVPFTFTKETEWHEHLDDKHFNPIMWEQGDGPASGLSDAHDSEAYLSDAQGRQVTPRITADPARHGRESPFTHAEPSRVPRGRGRPPKASPAHDAQKYLVSQKKRVGGPGIDRGGATLVTEKRRKGFSDNDDTEEEFVDVES
ncbi:hypothetical protein K505DRAFT_245279 [Melanomma pulvis-pyrius CBS 109.77]|uniref:C2H2-type domain-containing protein n=1 Tax=Melanomma pulvis-pyrius CBS 109.77 TaxID=1314802 RepID=A0A6A6XA81_9PLEO|nr:hypothetical protein K505DRAFT_245279 [Melanomma pulvis-pyrius CBS 109.77]